MRADTKRPKILSILSNVSRETFSRIWMLLVFTLLLGLITGCGEDSIPEDVSGINKVLSAKYDISSAEQLAKFYYGYIYNNPGSKLTLEISPQTHGRVKIVLIDHNPARDNMLAEKFEIIAKQNETTWKLVVVNRNWKCKSTGEAGEWGTDPCN